MSTIDITRRGNFDDDNATPASLQRIGQIAGLLTIAVIVFGALYFLVLYLASE